MMLSKTLLSALTALAYVTSAASAWNNMLVIVLENADYSTAIADPNLKAFADSGILFTNSHANYHPSQPNYIAMTSGSTNGVTSDAVVTLQVRNIADLLEAKGFTWKSYQENWPSSCFTLASDRYGLYYRKHNPFISYANIQQNATRCANIVDASQLTTDIAQGNLPTLAWYTPNIENDGNNTSVAFAGTWLSNFLASTGATSHFDVVLVTFDESVSTTNNQIYTAIAGKGVTNGGYSDIQYHDTYSLLATLEVHFSLGSLTANDARSYPFYN